MFDLLSSIYHEFDLILLTQLIIFWSIITYCCCLLFDCPKNLFTEHGKKPKKYMMFMGNYASIIHAICSTSLGNITLLN